MAGIQTSSETTTQLSRDSRNNTELKLTGENISTALLSFVISQSGSYLLGKIIYFYVDLQIQMTIQAKKRE